MRGQTVPSAQPREDRQQALLGVASRVELSGEMVVLRLQKGAKPEEHQAGFASWVRENAGTGFDMGTTKPNNGEAGLRVTISGASNDPREVFTDLKAAVENYKPAVATPSADNEKPKATYPTRTKSQRPMVDINAEFTAREKAMFDDAANVARNGNWVTLQFKQGVAPQQYKGAFNSWMRENVGTGFEIKPAKPANGQEGLKVLITGAHNNPKETYDALKGRVKALRRPAQEFTQQKHGVAPVVVAQAIPGEFGKGAAANEGHRQMAAGQPSDSVTRAQPTSRVSAYQQS